MTAGRPLVARFREALGANLTGAHGPLVPDEAADLAVRIAREHADGRAVAVASGDPVIAALDLPARLRAAGSDVVVPDGDGWAVDLAEAGVGVTGAVYGLAATGSVGVVCGPGAPRATSLVPPAHVCLVRAVDVVEDLGEALTALATTGTLPSNLVWVGGPSRSADLEMTLTLGVHGPAAVDVVLIGEPG